MGIVCKVGLRVMLIFLLVGCYPEEENLIERPSVNLSSRDVVMAQLKALQKNDYPEDNFGIKVAYNFASPYQKAENGPFTRYRSMYNSRRFNTLINCSEFFIERHFANEKKAEYFVFVTDQEGKEWVFLFRLSRQTISPYSGCWMTDTIYAYADARALTGHYFVA
jgi:hypothetical protein